MVENLVDEYELVGMSAEQIVELLGEPEHKSKNEFRYYLGYTQSGINTGSLSIKLEKGKVIDYNIDEG